MVICGLLEANGLNGSSWWLLFQVNIEIISIRIDGMIHQMVSAIRLPSRSGLYLALVLLSRYFQANAKSKVNTGMTTTRLSSKPVINRFSSWRPTGPLGSRTGIFVPCRYQAASKTKPKTGIAISVARDFLFIFLLRQ